MRSRAAFAVLSFVPLALIACGGADKPAPAPPAQPAMAQGAATSMRNAFVDSYMRKDSVGAAAFYADNAVMVGPDGKEVTGKPAIVSAFGGMIKAGMDSLALASTGFQADGDKAVDRGTWVMRTLDPKTKEATRANGTYAVYFARQPDQTFKIVLDSTIAAGGAMGGAMGASGGAMGASGGAKAASGGTMAPAKK
jgi:ketosteroid isomerase-like protein